MVRRRTILLLAASLAVILAATLVLLSMRRTKNPAMLEARFVTDVRTLARGLKKLHPGVEILITESTPLHSRLDLKETVLLTEADMPTNLHLYALGPVLPIGNAGFVLGLQRDSRLLRFSMEGSFLGEVGRGTGHGPGELAGPFRVRVSRADSSIWVYCSGSALLQHFTSEGQYLWSTTISIPNSFLRDFAVDVAQSRLWATFWDWESRAPIHVFSLHGKQLRSFGHGPLIKGKASPLPSRSMGFWENYAAGYLILDGDRIVFAHSCPYQVDVYDTLGRLEKVILRPGKFVRPPAFRQIGSSGFVGPYTFQTTAIGIAAKGIMVWSVSEKPGPEESRYLSVLDVISTDGHLLYSKRWHELRWVWAFREDGSFLAARRTSSGEDVVVNCAFPETGVAKSEPRASGS